MPFEFEITSDRSNKYLKEKTRDYYLELAAGWKDTAPAPAIGNLNGATVWDDSVTGLGTKGRWGDLLISKVQQKEVVYVQPRVGWAGMSLSALVDKYDKNLTLFMPASKRISDHQLICVERGAKTKFRRIAAMPVLNKYAKDYADEVGGFFVPFGLDHELVVAAGVASTLQQWGDRPEPKHIVSVVSTGVLSRTLQIAFPNAEFHGVAVARNLKAGEIGRAKVMSYHRPFLQDADEAARIIEETGISSAPNYDMKGIEYLIRGKLGVPMTPETLFWNVAGDIKPSFMKHEDVDSAREWGEVR